MALKEVDFRENPKIRKQIKALYTEAFPKEERLPWWLLCLSSCRKGVDLSAWMEDDKFCGMTASITVEDLHFLLFFAVEGSLRGGGCGSRILTLLRQRYGEVVLNVEPLVEDAPNLPMRKRRLGFYKRNGFYDTGWYVWEVGGMFRVLSTKPQLDVKQYRKIFRKLTFGIWNVKLRKAEEEETECY